MITLKPYSGEFVKSEQEAAFQASHLADSRAQARLIFWLAASLNALFLMSDWWFYHAHLAAVAMPVRFAMIICSIVCACLYKHMTSFRSVELICASWQLVMAICVALLVTARTEISLVTIILLPLVFYLVLPSSFRGNVIGGFICSLFVTTGYLTSLTLSEHTVGMLLSMLTLHCSLWIVVVRKNRSQRMEWLATEKAEQACLALGRTTETLERIFHTVPVPLLVARLDGSIIRHNAASKKLLSNAEDLTAIRIDNEVEAPLLDRLRRWEIIDNCECQLVAADGETHDILLGARTVELENHQCILASIVDINDLKEAERHLAHLAMTDSLTGVANRSHFLAGLNHAAAATTHAGSGMAVIFIDVDEFKRVNDSIGHDAGDALLCAVAERLRSSVRPSDLIARMGGDEFAVLLTRIRDASDLRLIIDRMTAALRQPLIFGSRTIDCRVSMGIAMYPNDASNMDELIKHADLALYEAKNSGGGRPCLYEPTLLENWQVEERMLDRAREALIKTPPIAWYQPKIDLKSGQIIGFEALLRCIREDESVMMPGEIAAAFEHPELGCAITARMIDVILDDCKNWEKMGLDFGHIAINIPGVELHNSEFPATLLSKIIASNVSPHRIEIEVTESVFLGRHAAVVERNLNILTQAGISIALDDFGTGYASLSHLKQFPIDVIKIDQHFVRDLESDPEDAAIVGAVLNLAYSLGIKTVAEGVENETQIAYLRAGGCHYAQGFFYGGAIPPGEATCLLETGIFEPN